MSNQTNLQYLFRPNSVAILGASADLHKVSGRPLSYMLRFGYPGRIFPINPKYSEIAGVPCYRTLAEVPSNVDLLLMIIPATEILANLETGVTKGVKAAVIISGGFAEVGEEGKKLQQELTRFSRRTGLRLYGPNTTGFLSLVHRTVATFSQSLEVTEQLLPGKTGLITQSGAFGATIFVSAMRRNLGISHWAATGNEADLEFSDFLEYMATDPETQVITGFLSGVEDGPKLLRALDLASENGKPVVMLKVGGTEAARRAAYSHTGAMVGSSRVYDAVFQQKGVIVARDVPELVDYALAFITTKPPKGRRVGILTESGGGGVLLTERCSESGLEVAEILGATQQKLQTVVPALGSVKNPVDLTGQSLTDPALVKSALDVMLESDDFDAIIPMLLMSEETAERKAMDLVSSLQERIGEKAIIVCWPEGPARWAQFLASRSICVAETATRCAQTLSALWNFGDFLRRRKEQVDASGRIPLPPDRKERTLEIIQRTLLRGETRLSEYESKQILKAYGIPVTEEILTASADDAVIAAERSGYPVALKLVSPDIPHKTDAGVLALNVADAGEVRRLFSTLVEKGRAYLPSARIEGILVQEMIPESGIETIIGISREAPFGPVILFGLGGIFVEALRDVALRLVPLGPAEAEEMIRQIRGFPVLQGFRGRPPSDIPALVDVLLRVSALAEEFSESILELDINPLIVLGEGKRAKAVDALFSLRPAGKTEAVERI